MPARVPPDAPGPDELPELAAAVLDLVDLVPPGRVVTYGDLARALGCGPRQVGAVMARHGAAVDWWRVLRADGSPPPGHERRAIEHYHAEGTPLRRGGTAVDLRLARWDGVLEDPDLDRWPGGMSAQPYHRVRLTLAEYLKFEELHPDRHELVDGEVRLMAGGSESHDLLTQLLNVRLAPDFMSRGCRVFIHHRKLRTTDDNVYFPDLMIVCGRAPHRQYEEAPTWLFEVVSPGNTAHDLADKLTHYCAIASLEGYVILDPDAGTVTLHRRHDLGWTTTDVTGGVIDLDAVQLDLVELYGDLARVVTAD